MTTGSAVPRTGPPRSGRLAASWGGSSCDLPAANPDEVEPGYRLAPEAWGRGYATEGAVALVLRAFDELGMVRVVATTTAVNLGSRRVLGKAGLRLVRIVHEDWPIRSTAPSRGTRSTS